LQLTHRVIEGASERAFVDVELEDPLAVASDRARLRQRDVTQLNGSIETGMAATVLSAYEEARSTR
jgi:hypothetical protein